MEIGWCDAGDVLTFTNTEENSTKNVAVTLYRMDETTLKDFYNEAMKNPFVVDHFEDTKITGYVEVPQGGGLLFTTIAAEEGWEVFVDGQKVDYQTLKKTYIGSPLKAGHHEIEFRYHVPMLLPSALISIGAWLIMLLIGIFPFLRKAAEKQKAKRAAAAAGAGGSMMPVIETDALEQALAENETVSEQPELPGQEEPASSDAAETSGESSEHPAEAAEETSQEAPEETPEEVSEESSGENAAEQAEEEPAEKTGEELSEIVEEEPTEKAEEEPVENSGEEPLEKAEDEPAETAGEAPSDAAAEDDEVQDVPFGAEEPEEETEGENSGLPDISSLEEDFDEAFSEVSEMKEAFPWQAASEPAFRSQSPEISSNTIQLEEDPSEKH